MGSSEAAEHVTNIRKKLYQRYGHGALTKAAEEIGEARDRVSYLLSPKAREVLTELQALAEEAE
jgi:hypothetical protein